MPTAQSKAVFCEPSIFLKRDVILTRGTWHGKILSDHPELEGHIGLIKEAVKNCSAKDVYIQSDGRLFIQVEAERFFRPYNNQLRIGINFKDAGHAEIPTAFPVSSFPQGVKFYDASK